MGIGWVGWNVNRIGVTVQRNATTTVNVFNVECPSGQNPAFTGPVQRELGGPE